MISLALSLYLGTSFLPQPIDNKSLSDTLLNKEIKEVTILGNLSNTFALPMVVVDKNTIEASSFFSPADALRRETGISLERDGIWATSVNIRGMSEQRLLFMVDGDRIQTATDIAGALSTVDMASIEKIEVIKGASSVLYGTGAMGGVVNFISKRPTYTPVFQTKGELETGFNTVNSFCENSANVQFSTNKWYLMLNGSFRTAQNIQTPGGILPNSQFHDASWGLKGGILYSENQEVLINYQHFNGWDIGLPGGQAFPATAVARYKDIARNLLSGEYIIKKINPNLREVRFKAYTQNISRDVELKPADPTVTLLPSSNNITSGAKLTTDWRFTDYHKLILGAEGWQRDATTSRMTIKSTSDSTSTVTGDQPTPSAKMLDLGVFAHYSWKIFPEKWTLNAGLRLDYIRTANDTAFSPLYKYSQINSIAGSTINYVKNLQRQILFTASVHEDIAYAADVDLVFNPTVNQQFSLSLANSYRVASIEERFKFIQLAGPVHVGNPNLKPENGTFSNLSYTLVTNHNFRIKTDIFVNYLNNLITESLGNFTFINANGTSQNQQAYVNVNIDKALFIGAELEGNWQISPRFSILANASYTHTRDIDANSPLPQIPPMSGFASLNYELKKQIGASFSALWAARQDEIAAGESFTNGHVVFNFDLHSSNIVLNSSQLKLFAGVGNILNTAYFDHLSTTRGILKLEPGRNIYLKVKYGW
jgi:hemoglobin/transferrin/lactoferrin receptor protein